MAGGLLAAHREYFFEIGGYGKRKSSKKQKLIVRILTFCLDDDMEVSKKNLMKNLDESFRLGLGRRKFRNIISSLDVWWKFGICSMFTCWTHLSTGSSV